MRKSDISRSYRDKYPDMPTLKLARIMYADHKLTFTNVEDARFALRYIEGKAGNSQMNKILKYKKEYIKEARPYNPYKLPASDLQPYEPYVISGFERLAILNDIHIPYHHLPALSQAIDELKKVIRPKDAILLNGDIIDCHRLSRWAKDPKKRDFKYEIDALKELISRLKEIFKCHIVYKLGNHESRYERFLYEKAGELAGIEEFTFENIVKVRASGIEVIHDSRYIQMGNLIGLHGHEFQGGGSGEQVARSLYLKGSINAFQGHNHRTDQYIKKNPFNGSMIRTYGIGCLCELNPAYNILQRYPWNHGYAWVEFSKDDFSFNNKAI